MFYLFKGDYKRKDLEYLVVNHLGSALQSWGVVWVRANGRGFSFVMSYSLNSLKGGI